MRLQALIILLFPILAFAQTKPRADQIKYTPSGDVVGVNVQTALDEVVAEKGRKNMTWITKTTNYTPVATDTLFTQPAFMMRSAGATSFTIPPFGTVDFNVGTSFLVYNDSTGTVSLLEGTGVTFETVVAGPWTLAEDEYAVITKSNSTNTWKLFAGNPGGSMTNPMTTAGDLITGGASGTPTRLALGTALHVLRVNAGGTAVEWAASAGGGITNSAANTELGMSDGTNITPSGVFVPSAGNLNLGTGLIGSNRTIAATGSATDIDLTFTTKGTSSAVFNAPTVYFTGTNNAYLYGSSSPTLWIGTPGTATGFVYGQTGQSGNPHGTSLTIGGGFGYTVSGDNNGGSLNLRSGAKRGAGTDGNITMDPLTGFISIANGSSTPSSPTNAVAVYGQDVSASAELFVKNEAGVVDRITEQEQTLNNVIASTGNVTTGEDQLFSYTLAASRLRVDGQAVQGRFSGIVANNANVKTIRLKFGSTTIATRTTTTPTIGQGWTIDWQCFRTGAATQRCNVTFSGSDGSASSYYATATETLSGTVAIVLTGDATATDDIIMHTAKTRFVP